MKGYSDDKDPMMEQFRLLVVSAGVPFRWEEPTVLLVLVQQILIDLGVPVATATQEAVDRFLSLSGLEEAAQGCIPSWSVVILTLDRSRGGAKARIRSSFS